MIDDNNSNKILFFEIDDILYLSGYRRLSREGRAPMASPDPLSMTSEDSSCTPDLEIL